MKSSIMDETVSVEDETVPVNSVVKRKQGAAEDCATSPKRRRNSSDQSEESPDLLHTDTFDYQDSQKYVTESQETIRFDLEPRTPEEERPGCSKDGLQENGLAEKLAISKIASLQRDSEVIANILDVRKDTIYDKLLSKRAAPNRIDLVTNELLEEVTNTEENGDEQEKSSSELIADVEWICGRIEQQNHDTKVDPNEVYLLLEKNVNKSDKCKIVLDELLNRSTKGDTSEDEAGIMKDVTTVTTAYPQADANVVYGLLESQENQGKRVECVLHILKGKFGDRKCEAGREDSPVMKDGVVDASGDPLHADVLLLAKMFPHKTHDELYAYLQAHRHESNRLQIVNRELLRVDEFEESPSLERSLSLTSDGGSQIHSKGPGKQSSRVTRELELLTAVYPLCDPNYLFERLEAYQHEKDRVQLVSQELERDSNYPRRKDTEAKLKRQTELKRMQDLGANLEELILEYPDISDHFYSSEKTMSENYKTHLTIQLKYDFPWLKSSFLDRVAKAHNFHLLPTYRQLQGLRPADVRNNCRKLVRAAANETDHPKYPNELDSYFFKELLFTMNEKKFNSRLSQVKQEKSRRLEEAKSLDLLQECGCCYDDEVLSEDTLTCPEGHLFCRACVRRSTEVNVGEAKAKFPCLTAGCDTTFHLPVIQKAVSPKTYALVLRRIQEEELREAGIENLVTCPFCSFATIMENPDDKVFKCLNSECMKESCRLCQEENHVPLRCDEVEKQTETDMRTFIENKMSEAMVRTCYKCKKRFYKIEGCNHMTCVCGAHMCYVCRAPLDGQAQHLNQDGRCSNANAEQIHTREVAQALQDARENYLKDHPEAGNLVLKYDPGQHLAPDAQSAAGNAGRNRSGFTLEANSYNDELWPEEENSSSDDDYEDYY